jgi:hypothetical protein
MPRLQPDLAETLALTFLDKRLATLAPEPAKQPLKNGSQPSVVGGA